MGPLEAWGRPRRVGPCSWGPMHSSVQQWSGDACGVAWREERALQGPGRSWGHVQAQRGDLESPVERHPQGQMHVVASAGLAGLPQRWTFVVLSADRAAPTRQQPARWAIRGQGLVGPVGGEQREGQLRGWLFGAGRGCAPGGRVGRWELHAVPSWAETRGSSRVSERGVGVPASPTGSKCSPGSWSAGPGEQRAICFPSADSLGPTPPSGACCTPASLPVSGNGKMPRAAQLAGTTVSVAFRPC